MQVFVTNFTSSGTPKVAESYAKSSLGFKAGMLHLAPKDPDRVISLDVIAFIGMYSRDLSVI